MALDVLGASTELGQIGKSDSVRQLPLYQSNITVLSSFSYPKCLGIREDLPF